jgi:riboflavin-specific deaminase-like protein
LAAGPLLYRLASGHNPKRQSQLSYRPDQQNRPSDHQGAVAAPLQDPDERRGWSLVCAAAEAIGTFDAQRPARFRLEPDGQLCRLEGAHFTADLIWDPSQGWQSPGAEAGAAAVLDLYLPLSSATARRPMTIAHLGQSLDGFIATRSGDSSFVTGPENILHLHRLRALCDVVVVGAGTVGADNPRLTTRLVAGRNPVRVVLDPAGRLPAKLAVFSDGEAQTLRVCASGKGPASHLLGPSECAVEIPAIGARLDLGALLVQLRARGYHRVLIEGGGVTVSSFLQAGLVDRLHLAIAPVLIGDGRPAVRLPPQLRLQDCLRLRHRIYRSGDDILFDCDLRAATDTGDALPGSGGTFQRIV